jgi:hypothetical protein
MELPQSMFVLVLLVPPIVFALGVAIGASFAYRLLRGMPPIPPLPQRAKKLPPPEKTQPSQIHPPAVRA